MGKIIKKKSFLKIYFSYSNIISKEKAQEDSLINEKNPVSFMSYIL